MNLSLFNMTILEDIKRNDMVLESWRVRNGHDFWWIMEWIQHDESRFYCNRYFIVDAFKNGHLHLLNAYHGSKDDELHRKLNPPGVSRSTGYRIPALCIVDDDAVCQLIWVASPFRRQGLGTTLVDLLNVCSTSSQLEESRGFWEKVDLEEDLSSRSYF